MSSETLQKLDAFFEFLQSNPCLILTLYNELQAAGVRKPTLLSTLVLPNEYNVLLKILDRNENEPVQNILQMQKEELIRLSATVFVTANRLQEDTDNQLGLDEEFADKVRALLDLVQNTIKEYSDTISIDNNTTARTFYKKCLDKLQVKKRLEDDE